MGVKLDLALRPAEEDLDPGPSPTRRSPLELNSRNMPGRRLKLLSACLERGSASTKWIACPSNHKYDLGSSPSSVTEHRAEVWDVIEIWHGGEKC